MHIPFFARTVSRNRFMWNICPILLGLRTVNTGKFLKLLPLWAAVASSNSGLMDSFLGEDFTYFTCALPDCDMLIRKE
jgi:hypothetical protein